MTEFLRQKLKKGTKYINHEGQKIYKTWKFRNCGQNNTSPIKVRRKNFTSCGNSGEYTAAKLPQEGDRILSSLNNQDRQCNYSHN